MITGKACLAGVIGWPVKQSRSPLLHNHWLNTLGLDGAYVPMAVRPEHVGVAIRGLRAAGFAGVNVTVPHKEAAFALCDHVDAAAAACEAANTLVFAPDGVHGSNTDGWGFLANLRAHGVMPGGRALLLGAGGAARAIGAALLAAGCAVVVANRSLARAEALAALLPGLEVVLWEARTLALAGADLLVNTTVLGMQGQPALTIDLSVARPGLAVADIVYVPLETPLLTAARARGLHVIPGLGMLLHQAVPGFEAWFGTRPVVDAAVVALLSRDIPAN